MAAYIQVFSPVSPPILRSVDPTKVHFSLKEWERYENEVACKRLELPSLTRLPYKAIIDRVLLQNVMSMGELEDVLPYATK